MATLLVILPFCSWRMCSDEGVNSSSLCSDGKVLPASHTHFYYHPLRVCQLVHPRAILWVKGCSVHAGVLSEKETCAICELEKLEQKEYPSISLRDKVGYPGDDHVAQA